ncbi:hypothetical protein BKA63DRAFT_272575 [Paraphoma chrysanthemicola]|nr:hypothetical protein BKA63DRAFT_272575 [Paraphoma chrysanthemicola]
MALRNAWWMKAEPVASPPSSTSAQPHQLWPWNQASSGIRFEVLEAYLRDHSGSCCNIEVLSYTGSVLGWLYLGTLSNVSELLGRIEALDKSMQGSTFYIVKYAESEVIQALGHGLFITPRFFNQPYTRLTTVDPTPRQLLFSLQFMDMYPMGTRPSEAKRMGRSPGYQFRSSSTSRFDHVWHVTCIRLILLKKSVDEKSVGLVQVDSVDEAIADGLKILLLRKEEDSVYGSEPYAGWVRLLTNITYIVTFTWRAFFIEAERHILILSEECLNTNLTSIEQLHYSRELHQLTALWWQVRRRLVAAKDLLEQLSHYPFFSATTQGDNGDGGHETLKLLLHRNSKVIDDQISRCNEIAEQTNVLVSLIFSIATLQDTKAAVEESKAANSVAVSVQRVAMLTFLYLPLTLASSIFRMNITQITGSQSDSPLWAYFIVAVSLMCAAFGGLFTWKFSQSVLQRRASKLNHTSPKV